MLKGFFANINMKAKNKVKSSTTTLEPFTLFLAFMVMLAKNSFNPLGPVGRFFNHHFFVNMLKNGLKIDKIKK